MVRDELFWEKLEWNCQLDAMYGELADNPDEWDEDEADLDIEIE